MLYAKTSSNDANRGQGKKTVGKWAVEVIVGSSEGKVTQNKNYNKATFDCVSRCKISLGCFSEKGSSQLHHQA